MTFTLKAEAFSHIGMIRANNQDSGYAGNKLFFVADGMGGYAGGDVASAIAVAALRELDNDGTTLENPEALLTETVRKANREIIQAVEDNRDLARMGTTLSALWQIGDQAYIAHIGDSRIYLLRDKKLVQKTVDHTFVQRLVDSGRITPEEALVHPRRSVLMRVLGDVSGEPEVDIEIAELQLGDRWLICSDGLSGYVPERTIQQILIEAKDLKQANRELLKYALESGAPDNVTGILVEVVEESSTSNPVQVVGSASDPEVRKGIPDKGIFNLGILRHPLKAVQSAVQKVETHVTTNQEDYLQAIIEQDLRREKFRKLRWMVTLGAVLLAIGIALFFGYKWTQEQYFVGVQDGQVAIFRGLNQPIGPISLSELVQITGPALAELQPYTQHEVTKSIAASNLADAQRIVEALWNDVRD